MRNIIAKLDPPTALQLKNKIIATSLFNFGPPSKEERHKLKLIIQSSKLGFLDRMKTLTFVCDVIEQKRTARVLDEQLNDIARKNQI